LAKALKFFSKYIHENWQKSWSWTPPLQKKCLHVRHGVNSALDLSISLRHDDIKNQNKPAALVGFIGGQLSNNTVIILPF